LKKQIKFESLFLDHLLVYEFLVFNTKAIILSYINNLTIAYYLNTISKDQIEEKIYVVYLNINTI